MHCEHASARSMAQGRKPHEREHVKGTICSAMMRTWLMTAATVGLVMMAFRAGICSRWRCHQARSVSSVQSR